MKSNKYIETTLNGYINRNNCINEMKLVDVFDEYPSDDELIWNFIGLDDFNDYDFPIKEINIKEIITQEFIDNFNKNAQPFQKELVDYMVNYIEEVVNKPIVVDLNNKIVIDGNHKLMALYLSGIDIVKIIDINS